MKRGKKTESEGEKKSKTERVNEDIAKTVGQYMGSPTQAATATTKVDSHVQYTVVKAAGTKSVDVNGDVTGQGSSGLPPDTAKLERDLNKLRLEMAAIRDRVDGKCSCGGDKRTASKHTKHGIISITYCPACIPDPFEALGA